MAISTSPASTRPAPRKLPGPEPKPLARSVYKLPPAVTRITRTYSQRRKLEVLLFIENHRIPLRQDLSDLVGVRVVGDSPVEDGFRRPFLREAAEYFGIQSWGTVQTWWSKRHLIWQGPRRRPPVYRPRWPAMESKLYAEFCAARQNRRLVQRTWFRRRSIAIFANLYPRCPDVFVFSNGWFRGFLRRHQITHRRVTHASTKVPDEVVKYTNDFLQFIRRNSRVEAWKSVALMSDPDEGLSMQRFPPHLIVNLDETPLPFEFLEGFTYDHKGVQSVQGKSERSGWSKRQATLVLSLVGDGSRVDELRPIVIFHGKGNVMAKESPLYHPGVDVKFNDTAYNNETLFEDWIRTRLATYTAGRESLLIIDVATFHKTSKVQAALKEHNITTALIPAGLTGYLQPLDVGFNGPFKKWLRDESDLYLDRLEASGNVPDRWSVRDRRVMTTHIVGNAWDRAFSTENRSMVAGLFKKTGISIHPDGREDHLISIKGIDTSRLRLDDWYRPPEVRANDDISEVSASLDGINEEFVSTTEAMGMPPNDYRKLKNKELKECCRARGLPVSGRKMELVQRLEQDDAAKATQNASDQRRHREQRNDGSSDQEVAGGPQVGLDADPVYPAIDMGTRATLTNADEPDDEDPESPHEEIERAADV